MRFISRFKILCTIASIALFTSITVHAAEPPTEPLLRIDPGEHTAIIKHIATDEAGRYVVTASHDKTARVWRVADGQLLSTLRIPIGSGNEGQLNAVALSPDGQTVALGGWTDDENSAYLFDRASGRLLRRLTGLPEVINYLAFSPDGRSLAATFGDNGLRLFSVADGRLLAQDTDYGGDSYSVHFSPHALNGNEQRLVTTSWDGSLRLYRWDSAQLTLLAKRTAPGGSQPLAARFSPDGNSIAVGFDDTPAVNVLHAADLSFDYAPDIAGVDASLGSVAWSQRGDFLVAGGSAQMKFDGLWQFYMRRWPTHGNGAFSDWPVARNMLTDLVSLSGGRLLFGSAEPSWGVVNAQGQRTLFHAPVIADFREIQGGFTLSADGTQVRFGYESNGKSPAVFDSQHRAFVAEQALPSPPFIGGHGLNFTDWQNTTSPKLNGTPLSMAANEISRSLALFPNGRGFALGTNQNLRLFDRNGKQLWRKAAPGEVWAVNVSQDGRVVAAYGDGTIRWHRISDSAEQLAFFPHADKKRWIMWTPEGYYDASPGAENLIGWHLNQGKDKEARFIPSGQLYDVFFRPDIVQAKFRGEDISDLITITAAQALKNPPPILSFTKVPSTTKSNMEKVCYKAVATGGGIGEVRLFQNGKLIKSDGFYRETVAKADTHIKLASMDSATISRALKLTKAAQKNEPPMVVAKGKGNEVEECQDIETIPGDNEISVAAFNANNTIQSALETTHFTADRKAEAPHLYVLGIGINKYAASENNLSYAVKDATDFRGMIQDKAKGLFEAANIHIEGLSDAQATKAGIQQAIAAISAKVKPWDSFILFVASHGYLQDNQYYIVTAGFDGTLDKANMISSNEIVGMSKNIKSLSQLLIFDTCHAGGVDNIIGGLYDARMSVMAKKMGLHIYASAGSTQSALDGYKGNGLFTHALLKSMKAGSVTDSNRDSEVSVAELGESARQETMDISKTLGFPQSPTIINFGKDNALFRVK
ncbi:MAG: caspase family protein [Gallionellaceae bacterium]